MKKIIHFINLSFLLAITTTAIAQTDGNTNLENWSSPQGVFDKVYDGAGTSYNITSILAGKTYTVNAIPTTSVLLCTSGIFELYFETGCGMEVTTNTLHNQRRAILCQAFQDVSDFINTPLKNAGNTTKVKIWIRNKANTTVTSEESARGMTYHALPFPGAIGNVNKGGISDGEVWRTIHAGKDSYTNVVFPVMNTENPQGIYHGYMAFNFTNPNIVWNYTYSKYNAATGFPAGNTDFYTQAIREITHMLGVASLLDQSGGSTISFLPNAGYVAPYYSRFDKFLKSYSNPTTLAPVLLNTPATNGQMYGFAAQNVSKLTPGCAVYPPVSPTPTDYSNCPTSLQYIGSINLPLFTPKCFEKYFSFSHFEDSCYGTAGNDNYFVLSNKENGFIAKRTLVAEERLVLNDIGYSVKGTFGNTGNFTYKNYGVGDSAGIPVGGVNDAFTTAGAYVYQVNSGTDITLTGFLSNDYIASGATNLRFEFLEDLYDLNATFTATLGTTATNVVYGSYVPGIHILRYVPYDDVTGMRGNITYIAVNVINNCAVNNPCELVRNGDFEQYNLTPNANPIIMNSCGWQNADYRGTADYFNTAVNLPSYSVPCNFMGNQPDRIAGNHAYAGGIFSTTMCENIKTQLTTALLPNTSYQLKFDVSLAESRSQKSIKFQAFITDSELPLTVNGFIPPSAITADKVFITNTTFSNAANAASNGWQTITLNFTTSSNVNLKYLYLGGLNNVQMQNETAQALVCPVSYGAFAGSAYYYIDNVSVVKTTVTTIDAVNDDFSGMPIDGIAGGVTTSVYANDLYNGAASSAATLANVTFALVAPVAIAGASINTSGLISIPAGTAAGSYTLIYRLSVMGNCTTTDTATVTVLVVQDSTPPIAPGIRANSVVFDIGLQSSGKSIIAGFFSTYNNIARNCIARLNTDLTLDATFTSSGAAIVGNNPESIAIQSDNKIVAVGNFTGFSGGTNGFGIARLLPDGELDTAFNIGGTGITPYAGYTSNTPYYCIVQPDGKIIIGGDFYYYNGVSKLSIVRLNSNGSIDTTFNATELNTYYRSVVRKIILQPDGKMILLGYFSSSTPTDTIKNLIRLNANGTIDASFIRGDLAGSVGHTTISTSLSLPLAEAILQLDGKIIVSGAFTKYNGTNVKCIVRLFSNGQVDTSFGTTSGVDRVIHEIILEPTTNKIIAGGEFTTFNGMAVKKMIRLNTNGTLDTTFNIGVGTTDDMSSYGFGFNNIRVLKQQTDGKIIVGGKFTTFNGLSATNITRIFGSSGVQAKGSVLEYQSEPEIDINKRTALGDDKISFYPNPSNGIFNINLENVIDKYETIEVYNLLGEKVLSEIIDNRTNLTINLSQFSSGYYIAKVKNEEKTVQLKLIKQ